MKVHLQIEIIRPQMRIERRALRWQALLLALVLALTAATSRLRADTGTCGGANVTLPFTDVMGNPFFCAIALAYFSGLTNGTTATTYSPTVTVTREQMAAFVGRTLDQAVKRSHPRAALGEWWMNKLGRYRVYTYTNAHNPRFLACDGQTVWVSNTEANSVSRVDTRTAELMCTLTSIPTPEQMVIVSGNVYITSYQSPGKIYNTGIYRTTDGMISAAFSNLGNNPTGITYDGQNLWTANNGTGPGTGSISRVYLDNGATTTFTTEFNQPVGILFDGVNLWVTDAGDTSLKRVDTNTGAVMQTTALQGTVGYPVFDGTNLWIPCARPTGSVVDRLFVVRAVGGPPLLGTVLARLTGNGMDGAFQAAFDGERICVTNATAQTVSLWKASDLSPIGSVTVGFADFSPRGICSDGITFFIGMRDPGGLGAVARF
jgi:hypothetical protein